MFDNRGQGGLRLAERLMPLAGRDVVVLGLPRGGVPVAFEAVTPEEVAAAERHERVVLEHRCRRWRRAGSPLPLTGRTVVNDGMATGSTASAACRVARARGAGRVVLAVPVAPAEAAARLHGDADEVVVLQTPRRFTSVGQWHADFAPTTDDEVSDLLARAAAARTSGASSCQGPRPVSERTRPS